MKTLALLVMLSVTAMAQAMSPEERESLLKELTRTRDLMLAATEDLSPKQAEFKQSPERWSVLQCAEHMAVTEQAVFMLIQQTLKGPQAAEADREKTKGKTPMLIKALPDRSRKATAPVEVAPSGRFATLAEAREAFQVARAKTMEFVGTSDLPLHSYISKHFAFGELDTYQWLILMSGHVERHTNQVNEVKAAMTP